MRGDRWKRELGACIRESRIHHGWTQEELAQRLKSCGFHRSSRALLSQIEAGSAVIRGYELYYLRQAFGKAFEREFWSPFHQGNPEDPDTSKEKQV